MPSHYASLVRLNKWKVDERSRTLGLLLNEAQALADKETALLVEIEQERAAAAGSIEAGALFAGYVVAVHERRRRLEAERAKVERQIEIARDELRAAMGEARKFEIAEASAKARERAERLAKDNAALDEAALSVFRRKGEDGL
jgi:flagellar export protein FliJ